MKQQLLTIISVFFMMFMLSPIYAGAELVATEDYKTESEEQSEKEEKEDKEDKDEKEEEDDINSISIDPTEPGVG